MKTNTTGTLVLLIALVLVYLSDSGKLSKMVTIIKGPPLNPPANSTSTNPITNWLLNPSFANLGGPVVQKIVSGLTGNIGGTGG